MRPPAILIVVLVTTLLAGWAPAEVDPDLRQVYTARYLNRTFFLLRPLPGDPTRLVVGPGGRGLPGAGADRPLIEPGEQVQVTDIRFQRDEIRFRVLTPDRARKVDIRFSFPTPLDGRFQASEDFNALLAGLFSLGLSPRAVTDAQRDYLTERYRSYVAEMSRAERTTEADVHEAAALAHPVARDLRTDVGNLQRRLGEVNDVLARQRQEAISTTRELTGLRERQARLESTVREAQERSKGLEAERDRLRRQLEGRERELENLNRAVRQAAAEVGLRVDARESGETLPGRLAVAARQAAAASQALQVRLENLQTELAARTAETRTLESRVAELDRQATELAGRLERTQRAEADLTRQVQALASKDAQTARQVLDLQQRKERLESRLLSRTLLEVQSERERRDGQQVIVVRLSLKGRDLGTLTLSAPAGLEVGRPTRLTLATDLVAAEGLKADGDDEIDLLLRNVNRFPDFEVSGDSRSAGGGLTLVQSPERDNTPLWVWEATAPPRTDVDVVFRFGARLAGEPLPLFEVPVSIPFPTMERALAPLAQPVPFGLGFLTGAVLAGGVGWLLGRRKRRDPPGPADSGGRPAPLHFDHKDL